MPQTVESRPVARQTPQQRFSQLRTIVVAAKRLIQELQGVLDEASPILADGANEPRGPITSPDDLLNSVQAARLLGTTADDLRGWRNHNIGPAYIRLTNRTIRYKRGDLETFIASRRVITEPQVDGDTTEVETPVGASTVEIVTEPRADGGKTEDSLQI